MLQGWFQIALTLLIVVAITPLLGGHMAQIFLGKRTILDPILSPVESLIYKLSGISIKESMTGWQYTQAVFYSNLIGALMVALLLSFQASLPLNPTGLSAPPWDVILHTTISFLTNTNQQHYSGETTLSYLTQTLAIGFLFFLSAATGLAVGIAFIRGLTGRSLGNFYVDLTVSITRILLPISLIGAITFMALGMPETLSGPVVVPTLEAPNISQAIAIGPVAHFEIIKQLGENGGGFFGQNSAHPFENPNPASNLIATVAMVSIPASLIYTFGVIANNKKQGWLVFGMVLILSAVLIAVVAIGEYQGNPLVNQLLGSSQPNLEGKEVRFGWAQTSLFLELTSGTMTGAVNGMLDSLMPLGGGVALFQLFMQIVWGGQGTGTAYIFIYLILSVFVTGLMVGRTPEFFGRKIEKFEVIMASVIILVHPLVILIPGAIAIAFPEQLAGMGNPSFHGLTSVFYEYASAAANNGSGFGSLGNLKPAPTSLWWNLSCSVVLLIGRYIPIAAMLLLADRMYRKQAVPLTDGTLRTDTVLFTGVTAGVILILGALTFFPILVLGPIAEAFQVIKGV